MGRATKTDARLPLCYDGMEIEFCDEPLSVELEIARWLASREEQCGRRPVTLFRNIVEYPESVILGNPYPRRAVLAALGVDPKNWQEQIWKRLQCAVPRLSHNSERWLALSGLDALPVLRHRPGDAGRYITAGVTACRSTSTKRVNLGVYRIQLVSESKARIFFDPRTDAFRNWQESLAAGQPLPITIFLGADPINILVAASRLSSQEDDFTFASRLCDRELCIVGDPPAPIDSNYVIHGVVTAQLESEGPFAEFKGYYVNARQSPVLEVNQVLACCDPVYPMIVTGTESGLTLMALQNEYLMYCHLRNQGFPILRVQYLLESRAEFTALLESSEPSVDLVHSAMDFDRRSKIVICGHSLSRPWESLASHGFDALSKPYYRKGEIDGDRIGLVLNRPPQGRPVEY